MSMACKITGSLFLFAMLISAGTASASVRLGDSNTNSLSKGLVGYWPFDGNTTSWTTNTTQDVSGNGNTGHLVGMSTTTSPVPGKIGGALNFKGTGYITTPIVASTAFANDVTISFWAKVSDFTTLGFFYGASGGGAQRFYARTFGGGSTGGMDDRFDMMLWTDGSPAGKQS